MHLTSILFFLKRQCGDYSPHSWKTPVYFPEKLLSLRLNIPKFVICILFLPPLFRSSLEKKDKADENTQWLEMHKKKCQAMSKSVSLRAKAMDPHKSLEEVFKAKLKENRSVSSTCQRSACLGIQWIIGLGTGKMEVLG